MNSFAIGSVICGTLKPCDLIPAFVDELTRREGHDAYNEEIEFANLVDPDSAEASEAVNALIEALNDLAPPYTCFGTHEGDGADFGWRPNIYSLEEDASAEDGVIKVNDLDDVPTTYNGLAMLVNDHGNITLYQVQALEDVQPSEFTEIWSCV